ncbi:hypothetical protein EYF80_055534 [Liparis tanakae]|uniref:Uncharacterized protein n=1 Tax=Liparis tanakae TaxID=230148 RepID=A0A4Z2F096_9TELE|nr:hypothetical protein EYF80_055534 [Liparis tanakae]
MGLGYSVGRHLVFHLAFIVVFIVGHIRLAFQRHLVELGQEEVLPAPGGGRGLHGPGVRHRFGRHRDPVRGGGDLRGSLQQRVLVADGLHADDVQKVLSVHVLGDGLALHRQPAAVVPDLWALGRRVARRGGCGFAVELPELLGEHHVDEVLRRDVQLQGQLQQLLHGPRVDEGGADQPLPLLPALLPLLRLVAHLQDLQQVVVHQLGVVVGLLLVLARAALHLLPLRLLLLAECPLHFFMAPIDHLLRLLPLLHRDPLISRGRVIVGRAPQAEPVLFLLLVVVVPEHVSLLAGEGGHPPELLEDGAQVGEALGRVLLLQVLRGAFGGVGVLLVLEHQRVFLVGSGEITVVCRRAHGDLGVFGAVPVRAAVVPGRRRGAGLRVFPGAILERLEEDFHQLLRGNVLSLRGGGWLAVRGTLVLLRGELQQDPELVHFVVIHGSGPGPVPLLQVLDVLQRLDHVGAGRVGGRLRLALPASEPVVAGDGGSLHGVSMEQEGEEDHGSPRGTLVVEMQHYRHGITCTSERARAIGPRDGVHSEVTTAARRGINHAKVTDRSGALQSVSRVRGQEHTQV